MVLRPVQSQLDRHDMLMKLAAVVQKEVENNPEQLPHEGADVHTVETPYPSKSGR